MAEGTTAADDELCMFSAQTFSGTANGFKAYAKHGVTATPAKEGYPFVELKRLYHSNMVKEKKNPQSLKTTPDVDFLSYTTA